MVYWPIAPLVGACGRTVYPGPESGVVGSRSATLTTGGSSYCPPAAPVCPGCMLVIGGGGACTAGACAPWLGAEDEVCEQLASNNPMSRTDSKPVARFILREFNLFLLRISFRCCVWDRRA